MAVLYLPLSGSVPISYGRLKLPTSILQSQLLSIKYYILRSKLKTP